MHGIKGITDHCAVWPETDTDIPAHTPGQITHRACIPVLYAHGTHIFWIRYVHERTQLGMWAQKDRSYIRKGIRYTSAWLQAQYTPGFLLLFRITRDTYIAISAKYMCRKGEKIILSRC